MHCSAYCILIDERLLPIVAVAIIAVLVIMAYSDHKQEKKRKDRINKDTNNPYWSRRNGTN